MPKLTPKASSTAPAKGLKVSGNPLQYDNLQILIEWQELMCRLASGLILPKLELDISIGHASNMTYKDLKISFTSPGPR